MKLAVSNVGFRAAPATDQVDGLIGWASADIGNFHVDGFIVRRTAAGRRRVFFPERQDGDGRLHTVVRPRSRHTARVIERRILEALSEQGVLT